jgi:uncharacterized protein YqeY
MADLKTQLKSDLTAAMKQRDELTTSTIRMLLTAMTTEEVAPGRTERELSDDEVLKVINREAKKRREAAEAFAGAGRTQQAEREKDEETVLARYLPAQLSEEELTRLVSAAITDAGANEPRQMGAVMKVLTPRVAGRADGKRVSDEVKRQLSG